MPRTTVQKVRDIFDTDVSDNTVTSWLDIATELVDDVDDASPSMGSDRLAKIEKLVAAHFIAAQDPRLEGYNVGGSSGSYQGETGMGFEGTLYGQRALALDKTGVLRDSTEGEDFTLSI